MMLRFQDMQAQYVPAVSLLRFQFFRPSQSLAAFKLAMNAIAQLVDQNVVAEGLIDLRGLPSMSWDKQLWVATNWLPRVSAPPSVQHVAFIMSPRGLYNQMTIETMHRAARHFIRYEVQFFSDTASALDWLLSFQNPAAQRAIEREWAESFRDENEE